MTRSWEVGLAVWERYDNLDDETDLLREIIVEIERDEADIVTPGDYSCYHGRGTVAVCAPGSQYAPEYWWSKYPEQTSPVWNLVNIFTPMSWMCTFLSIVSVSIFFLVSARIGASFFGVHTFTEQIVLSPFRSTFPLKF